MLTKSYFKKIDLKIHTQIRHVAAALDGQKKCTNKISRENVHGQTKPYIQELRYIQLACYTQVKAHSKAKRTVFKQFKQC
jgi:hypothetical protein